MIKLATAVLLFGIVCSAFNIDSVYNFEDDDDDRELDQTQNFNQPENDDDDQFELDLMTTMMSSKHLMTTNLARLK